MRDRIMFKAVRRQNRVLATCRGYDSRGARFEFELDPDGAAPQPDPTGRLGRPRRRRRPAARRVHLRRA